MVWVEAAAPTVTLPSATEFIVGEYDRMVIVAKKTGIKME